VDVGQAAVRKVFTTTPPIALQTILILSPENMPNAFRFNAEFIETLVIGRLDPDTGIEPDICLRDHAAYEKGVSRRHAAITRIDGIVHVVDLGAANGTFLNGTRLDFNEPHPLKHGDTLRLGHFLVQVVLRVAAGPRSS
jgi:pSer/pThr/pTyr-binding forkhead associated (FHA) protein